MIVTVTCNPAIDKTVYEDHTDFNIGGKGINVSKVLKKLNTDSICTGFLGKENAQVFYDELDKSGIGHHFIEIDGKARTNSKYIRNNELIEDNEKGPDVNDESIDKLKEYLETLSNDIVVISGSAPKNIDSSFYKDLVELLKRHDNYVIADCANDLFKEVVKAKPDMIKPNKDEICTYFKLDYNKDIIIDKCRNLNIDTICISLGSEGALFLKDDYVYEVEPLEVKYVSPVGCGDALVAGMAYGKYNNLEFEDCIRMAIACASASVEMSGSIPPEYEHIMSFKERVTL